MKRKNGLTHRFGPTLSNLLIVAVVFVVLFVMIALTMMPPQYDLSVGAIAKATIKATKDVEDVAATQQNIEAAMRAVELPYVSDSSVYDEVIAQVRDALAHLITVNGLGVDAEGKRVEVTDDLIWNAAAALSPVAVERELLTSVIFADSEVINEISGVTMEMVEQTMSEPFWQGQELAVAERLTTELQLSSYPEDLIEVIKAIVSEFLRPNMVLDEETLEKNREKARQEVEPVIYKRDQVIVNQNEVITESQYAMLNSLGLIKDRGLDWSMYIGIALLLLIMIGMIWLYLLTFEAEMLEDPRRVALLAVIVLTVMVLCMFFRIVNVFSMPVALGTMLVVLLLKPRLALTVGAVLSILSSLMATSSSGVLTTAMFSTILTSVFSSALCVAVIRRAQHRVSILLAGVIVSASNLLTTVAAGLINSADLNIVFLNGTWAAMSGIFSAVFCIGLQPALEWIFNIDTASKLMELSNPNQPLLRRLLLEAPGTYHHSILVANLAEAGASAIGANGLLARVGAYYHDIGKLKRPVYFKENQLGDNPHDRTDPRVSAAILTAHPTDGVQMAQKSRLPIPIQEIILQHHGDTPALFFYDKAMKQELNVDITDFRYPGPRPGTREGGIVMLADTVEAATRSIRDSAPEKIHQLIQRVVRSKLDDGQLDECPLTFSDLKIVTEAFMTVLTGVYHQRIEYPDVTIPQREIPESENKNDH